MNRHLASLLVAALVVQAAPAVAASNPGNTSPILPSISAYNCGALPGTATDQSAVINACLMLLSPKGGNLSIPLGVNFKLTSLTFPSQHSSITYFLNSDKSNFSYYGAQGTNELVTLFANSSCSVSGAPCNASHNDGAVSELLTTSPFGTASILGVRCDVNGFLKWQGFSQFQDAPCRAQFVIDDSNLSTFRIVHEYFMDQYNYFSANSLQGFTTLVQLNGVGTADWPSLPAHNAVITNTAGTARGFLETTAAGSTTIRVAKGVFAASDHLASTTTINGIGRGDWSTIPTLGATVTGLTSGAVGGFLDVGGSDTILIPSSGTFVTGEQITSGGVTPTPTISTVVNGSRPSPALTSFSNAADRNFPPLGQDLERGTWSCGQPEGLVRDEFACGGVIVATQTQTVGQYAFRTITNPGFCAIDGYGSVPNGYCINYNISAARLLAYPYVLDPVGSPPQAIADVTGVRVHVGFDNSVTAVSSSFNAGTITRTGTGVYTVAVPTSVFANATYQCTIGHVSPLDIPVVAARTATLITINNFNLDGTTAHDLRGELDLICSGGDK